MAKYLCRLFTSTTIAQPKLSSVISDYSASRLISSSAPRFQVHNENLREHAAPVVSDEKDKVHSEEEEILSHRESENEDAGEEGGGGGDYVNKETGEIGGPRGPEPTRYGDWERGGRCSDF